MSEKIGKTCLFLGAGASVPFGKPVTSAFKTMLIDKDYGNRFLNNILQSMLKVNSFADIEYVLKAVEEITEFSKTYGHEFFTTLVKTGISQQMVNYSGNTGSYLDVINTMIEIRTILEKEVFTTYSWNHDFDRVLPKIFDSLFDCLWPSKNDISVITTNYDKAIEEYCAKKNWRFVDGFKHDDSKGRFLWDREMFTGNDDKKNTVNVHLLKLHGSLTWKEHKIYGMERITVEQILDEKNYRKDFVIYPSLSPKNGAIEEPYTSIRDFFKEHMRNSNICVVIGFSFRDEHIKEIFREFYEKGKKLIVVSPSASKEISNLLRRPAILESIDNNEYQVKGTRVFCIDLGVSEETIVQVTTIINRIQSTN